jgi:uncharacterized protein YciW
MSHPSDGNNGLDWRARMDRFESGLEGLLQVQARHDTEIADLRTMFGRTLTVVETLASKVIEIAEAQRHTEERLNAFISVVDDKLAALAEAQRHTDERLNALISVVDDLVRRPPSGT